MGKEEVMSDLVMETKNYCFFCLEQIIRIQSSFETESLSPVYSIQYLSRYLGMDRERIFNHAEPIPLQLLAKVERSNLKVQLCDECVKLNATFSKLGKKLEQIAIEVTLSLHLIHNKLATAEKGRFRQCVEDTSNDDFREKLEIAEVLRAEAANKCIRKVNRSIQQPTVKIKKLTQKEAFAYSQRKMPIKTETDDSNEDMYDSWIDFDDTEQPHLSAGDVESKLDCKIVNFKTEPEYKPKVCKKILTRRANNRVHQEAVHLGVKKYNCPVCNRQFSEKRKLTRHYRMTMCRTGRAPKPTIHICYCDICERGFTKKCNLYTHLKEVHSKSQLRKQSCKVCGRKFSRPSNLKRHVNQIQIHSVNKLV